MTQDGQQRCIIQTVKTATMHCPLAALLIIVPNLVETAGVINSTRRVPYNLNIVRQALRICDNTNKKAVLPQGNRAMPQVFFSVEVYANNIPYKYKTSRASKATLQSSKLAGAKHNLTRNQDSKSFKITCLESAEKQ